MKELTAKKRFPLLAVPMSALLVLNGQAAGAENAQSRTSILEIQPFTIQEYESERSPEQEYESERSSEQEHRSELDSERDSESEDSGREEESETGSEQESETESETDTERSEEEERNTRLRYYLSSMPEGFLFPMVTDLQDEENHNAQLYDAESGAIYTLADTRRLHGLRPVFLHGEKVLFGPGAAQGDFLVEYRGLDMLEPVLEEKIAGYDGDWSVYLKNLNTGESFVINDRPMKSASVMKLFIMGTVYRAFESGELERNGEVMSLVQNMITVSDNESSNQLLYLLGDSSYERGIEKVNEFIREYGFSDMTTEYNGFENAATVMDGSHFNQVSAKDCGKLLEDVYRRVWVDRAASNEIEDMMLNQHTRYKIPGGLPEGVLCGNKTGEMDTTENDAAIVYSENCDYILVVLSSDWNSKDEAISRIASLSGTVYEYLN